CTECDNLLSIETHKVFKAKQPKSGGPVKRGVAFPTCISVNNCICHYSPLKSDKGKKEFMERDILKDGDVAKIDMGAHIDGFIATCAHTVVVGASVGSPVKGRKADVVLAAYFALEAALRKMKPSKPDSDVTNIVQEVAETFKCKPVQGML